MPTRLQNTIALFEDTAKGLSDYQNWTSFLTTAAHNFKYSFDDQILIYAQRPNATACAAFDWWKERNIWIKGGTRGIALLREDGNRFRLDYVFDISDTRDRYNRDVKLWQYDDAYEDSVIETLTNTFGELKVTTTVTDAIMSAAHNAVEDNKADYLRELKYARSGSFLTGLDDVNLNVRFMQTAEASVAYMIMERLHLQPKYTLDYYDFEHIRDFNTVDTLAILGSAVSSISETALREIARTISAEKNLSQKNFAKSENARYNENTNITQERNEDNDRGNIQDSGRLPTAEFGSTDNGGTPLEVRNDEADISENPPQEPIHTVDDVGRDTKSLGGGGQDSDRADTDDSRADGESGGRDGGLESARPDKMDAPDEQSFTFGGGDSAAGGGVQLNLFDLVLPYDTFLTEKVRHKLNKKKEDKNNVTWRTDNSIGRMTG